MNKTIIIIFLTLSSLLVKAQKQDSLSSTAPADSPLQSVEQMPEYPGGINLFYRFISSIIDYPKNARENGIEGKVFVQITVKSTGELDSIKAIRGPAKELNDEAVRVIKLSPRWKPGMQNGKPVTVKYVVPITFKLPKDDDIARDRNYQSPDFPGGPNSFYKFVGKNINYPEDSKKNKIQGKVSVQIIVKDTGELDSVQAVYGPNKELNDEAVRVMKLSPPWKPGRKNGKPITVRYLVVPIVFRLPEDDNNKEKNKN